MSCLICFCQIFDSLLRIMLDVFALIINSSQSKQGLFPPVFDRNLVVFDNIFRCADTFGKLPALIGNGDIALL